MDMDNRKKELHKLQNEELNGKGADTSVINSYKSKIDTIKSELDYISQKQSFVWNYEKIRENCLIVSRSCATTRRTMRCI